MEAMFNSMSETEKRQLDVTYKDKYGLSVIDEIKDETYSVANRDSLLAAWSSDPIEKLKLKAQSSELSGNYGNILAASRTPRTCRLRDHERTGDEHLQRAAEPRRVWAQRGHRRRQLEDPAGGDQKQELDIMIDPNALMDAQHEYLKAMQPSPYDSPI